MPVGNAAKQMMGDMVWCVSWGQGGAKREENNAAASQLDKIPLLREVEPPGLVLANKLVNLVRVHVVAVDRLPVLVAGDVFHLLVFHAGRVPAGGPPAEDACPLSVGELTPLDLTDARVAEVGALDGVAVRAAGALLAVAVEAEIPADGGSWGHFYVSILAVRLGATVSGKMQAGRGALRGGVMREIAVLAIEAVSLEQEILADRDFVGIVDIAAPRSLGTGTCRLG